VNPKLSSGGEQKPKPVVSFNFGISVPDSIAAGIEF
jgi:hypothetical protein